MPNNNFPDYIEKLISLNLKEKPILTIECELQGVYLNESVIIGNNEIGLFADKQFNKGFYYFI